jgi:hypothetical protein
MDDQIAMRDDEKTAGAVHIAVRDEQIWRERRTKGHRTSNKQLAAYLDAEGYHAPAPHIIRLWVAGWNEAEGAIPQDDDSPEGILALQVETLANAKVAFANADLGALMSTMETMRDAAVAISKHIVDNLKDVAIKSPADVDALAATMGRLAESAERMSRAGDYIRSRQVTAISDGRAIEAEIMDPEDEPPPPYALQALSTFNRATSSA